VAFAVGKWVQETCNELYQKISERTQQPAYYNKINFCTDGNEQNKNALLEFFNKDCINYGQVIKDKEKQIVYGIHKRKVIGNLSFDQISMAHVDGLCSALRERMKCSVRDAKTFAKKRQTIKNLLGIYQAYHNLIDARLGKTPCMREGITSFIWSWGKLLNAKIDVVK